MAAHLTLPVKNRFNWKVFLIVWAGAVVGVMGIIPYSLTLQTNLLATLELPIPLHVLLVVQVGQNALLFAGLAAAGLLIAGQIGLGLPYIQRWVEKEPAWQGLLRMLPLSIGTGVAAALVIIGLDVVIFAPALTSLVADTVADTSALKPPAWQGFLASFYGGITEEVMLRLFLFSLLAWLGGLASKTDEGRPTTAVFWVVNIAAAVLFGLGHLPATAAAGLPLNGLVITRAIVLNGVAGLCFGWLYWTRGLETALIAHFSADIVLHVIFAI